MSADTTGGGGSLPTWPEIIAAETDFATSFAAGKIATALAAAQGEIENAKADSKNPHFGSNYADLASIIEAIRAPLSKQGIARHQACLSRAGEVGVRTTLIHTSGEWISSVVYCKPDRPGAQALGSVLTYLRRYSLAAACGLAQDDDDGEASHGRVKPSARVKRETQDTTLPVSSSGAVPRAEYRDLVECWRWQKGQGGDQGEWLPMPTEPRRSNERSARLHALKDQLGLGDDRWTTALRRYNKDSSRDLSESEASDLIERLEKKWRVATEGDHAHASAAELAEYMTGSPTGKP